MVTIEEVEINPIDTFLEDDEEYNEPVRWCLECAEELPPDWEYDICEKCQDIKRYYYRLPCKGEWR